MDISSIASSFEASKNSSGISQNTTFVRTEFEEFLAALKGIIDAATTPKALDVAYSTAIDTIRSRLLSGRMLSCKMVRLCFLRRENNTSRIGRLWLWPHYSPRSPAAIFKP